METGAPGRARRPCPGRVFVALGRRLWSEIVVTRHESYQRRGYQTRTATPEPS
jgi:hypothetical protein